MLTSLFEKTFCFPLLTKISKISPKFPSANSKKANDFSTRLQRLAVLAGVTYEIRRGIVSAHFRFPPLSEREKQV